MCQWTQIVCCVTCLCVLVKPGKSLLGSKSVITLLSGSKAQYMTTTEEADSRLPTLENDQIASSMETILSSPEIREPSDPYPVLHAGLPRNLTVTPLPSRVHDHELVFNVSWLPPLGTPARDYSVVVNSTTRTKDCNSPMLCYEYNIPGNATWHIVPAVGSTMVDACTIHPGCAYELRLTPHPWDGHTAAFKHVELSECEADVCSCAYSSHLPAPRVAATIVPLRGELFVNVTWSLPTPDSIQRLPRNLTKRSYYVSIGKQMVSEAHPSPWFTRTLTRSVNTSGLVANGEASQWILVPTANRPEPRSERRDERSDKRIVLDVKLLARVSLVDDRGCVGPDGNAVAYDPTQGDPHIKLEAYAIWAVVGGACMLITVGVLAVSTRIVKRLLHAFRPAPVSAPREATCRRPAWFPLQLRATVLQQIYSSRSH